MKKIILALVAAAFAGSGLMTQAAEMAAGAPAGFSDPYRGGGAPGVGGARGFNLTSASADAATTAPTNVVQTITLSLTFISQVEYTNADAVIQGQVAGYTNWDVLRTNRMPRATNVVDTYTTIYKTVTNHYTTRDVVAALNPAMAGGVLVLVTSSTATNGNADLQIRNSSSNYVVPNGKLYLQTSAKSRTGADATVTSATYYNKTNVTTTVTPSSKGYRVELGNLVLNTPTLSFNISGKTVEGFGVAKVAGNYVPIKTTSGSFAGTGTDSQGFNEIVIGTVTVGPGVLKN